MRIINMFSVYFLVLMVVQGVIVAVLDYRSFYEAKQSNTAKKARIIGGCAIILSIALFIVKCIAQKM